MVIWWKNMLLQLACLMYTILSASITYVKMFNEDVYMFHNFLNEWLGEQTISLHQVEDDKCWRQPSTSRIGEWYKGSTVNLWIHSPLPNYISEVLCRCATKSKGKHPKKWSKTGWVIITMCTYKLPCPMVYGQEQNGCHPHSHYDAKSDGLNKCS